MSAIVLVLAGVIGLDALSAILLLAHRSQTLIWLVVHLLMSLVGGVLASHALPTRARRDDWIMAALFSLLSLFLPVIGLVGCALLAAFAFRARPAPPPEPWIIEEPLEIPEHAPAVRYLPSAEALTRVLERRDENPPPQRFHAVLRTHDLPPRSAVSVLKVALRDPNDEVRLYAFSRIEQLRSNLEAHAKKMNELLDAAETEEEQRRLHLVLAQTWWELAYMGLVDGAVLEHTLAKARDHLLSATENVANGPAEFMLGRVELACDQPATARVCFQKAIAAGYPRRRILPYLAECAFRMGRYQAVRELMRECARTQPDLYLQPIIEVWA